MPATVDVLHNQPDFLSPLPVSPLSVGSCDLWSSDDAGIDLPHSSPPFGRQVAVLVVRVSFSGVSFQFLRDDTSPYTTSPNTIPCWQVADLSELRTVVRTSYGVSGHLLDLGPWVASDGQVIDLFSCLVHTDHRHTAAWPPDTTRVPAGQVWAASAAGSLPCPVTAVLLSRARAVGLVPGLADGASGEALIVSALCATARHAVDLATAQTFRHHPALEVRWAAQQRLSGHPPVVAPAVAGLPSGQRQPESGTRVPSAPVALLVG